MCVHVCARARACVCCTSSQPLSYPALLFVVVVVVVHCLVMCNGAEAPAGSARWNVFDPQERSQSSVHDGCCVSHQRRCFSLSLSQLQTHTHIHIHTHTHNLSLILTSKWLLAVCALWCVRLVRSVCACVCV